MKHVALWVTLAGIATFSLGCGGGSGGSSLPTCSAFNACGGDITGTWTFDSVCAEGDIAASLLDTSGLPSQCSDVIKNLGLKMTGTLTYANGTETANATETVTARAVYSSACINAEAGGTVAVTQSLCDTIASSAASSGGPTMSCKLSNGGCDCSLTMTQDEQTTDTYTVTGGTLTYSDGSSIQYCVSGQTLTVRPPPSGSEPAMQFKLHRT